MFIFLPQAVFPGLRTSVPSQFVPMTTPRSLARATCVIPVQVNKLFELYQKWIIELHPNNIWNIDEFGLEEDVPKPQKVIGVSRETHSRIS